MSAGSSKLPLFLFSMNVKPLWVCFRRESLFETNETKSDGTESA